MYHKISSLMLNIAKNNTGHKEVFVAQPDLVTEKIAGKVFILFDLEGDKNNGRKIIEFLIQGIDEFFYQDEKLFIRDKIEGLELDNIFEAFLTKLNKALTDFLLSEKIRIKPADLNITIGLLFENQLLFSNFGRNKAFLIFRKKDQYEIINVEASATEVDLTENEDEDLKQGVNRDINFKIFSSVVNGEIPIGSYFFFTNEILPEYLSTKEMVLIITKLPPMVAAEQMKQSLAKVNSFAPFLGIIIKNTIGLKDEKENEELIETLSAQNSISGLNLTEKKTEAMLSPAGFIKSTKIKDFFSDLNSFFVNLFKKIAKIFQKKDKKVEAAVKETIKKGEKVTAPTSNINVKTKILVVRSSSGFSKFIKFFKNFFVNIFTARFWLNSFSSFVLQIKKIHPKRKLLISLTLVLIIVLSISLSITAKQKRQKEYQEYFDEQIASFLNRYNLIDSYLLYDNEDGVKIIIGEINEILNNLEAKTEEQEQVLSDWQDKLQIKREKIQRLTKLDKINKIFDARDLNPSAEPRNLILNQDIIYIADPTGKIFYTYNTTEQETSSFLINASGEINLDMPVLYNNRLYYLNNNKLAIVNPSTEQYEERIITGLNDLEIDAFDIYEVNSNLYTLNSSDNSILVHSPFPTYSQFNQWLIFEHNLSQAVDMLVTGEIWVLKSNAELIRFHRQFDDYRDNSFRLANIDPPLISANRLLSDDNNLYILDLNSSRLVIFRQDGSFVSQYELPKDLNIFDIIIDSNNQVVYLLADTALHSFSLQ